MALALLVKHTLVALPAALLLELLLRRTRLFKDMGRRLRVDVLVIGDFLRGDVGRPGVHQRAADAANVERLVISGKVERLVTPLLPLVVAIVLWLSSSAGWIRYRVFIVYAVASLMLAAALLGGDGVNYNMVFDLTIALTILLVWPPARRRMRRLSFDLDFVWRWWAPWPRQYCWLCRPPASPSTLNCRSCTSVSTMRQETSRKSRNTPIQLRVKPSRSATGRASNGHLIGSTHARR